MIAKIHNKIEQLLEIKSMIAKIHNKIEQLNRTVERKSPIKENRKMENMRGKVKHAGLKQRI